jgi:hypothetical protein
MGATSDAEEFVTGSIIIRRRLGKPSGQKR